jgi:hypothetical protein
MASPTQHRYDILASNLLFVGFLFAAVFNFLTNADLLKNPIFSGPASGVLVLLSAVIVLGYYYCIRQGYRWAKLLFFIFFGFSVLFLILGFKKVVATQFTSPLNGVGFAVQWLLRIAAFWLLVISFRSTRSHSE